MTQGPLSAFDLSEKEQRNAKQSYLGQTQTWIS